ncbi:MAG: PilW family protein [Deltaproteobacteria bacterium]|nr:PilW family protein [Deltaproteobacteria bacterium]MBW2068692.1 PilW family protein [Deltaproteobacteria bacterium]
MIVKRSKGVTLVELLVSIAVAVIVLGAVFQSYLAILKPQIQESKISESFIGSGMAFEILRKDIELAGFGLPWDMNGKTYSEAASSGSFTPNPTVFNDATSQVPRAIVFSDNGNTNASNSDVLVIKSTIASWNAEAMQWGYLYNDGGSVSYQPLSPEAGSSGYFSVLDVNKKLVDYKYQSTNFPLPSSGGIYLAYGLASVSPRMPFNRVDYYLKRPTNNFPEKCSNSSYLLYRSTINHGDGRRNEQPIMNCVLDFQVAFALDTNGDGDIDSWVSQEANYPNNAKDIREEVLEVRVFILHQSGQKDMGYTQSLDTCADDTKGIVIGDTATGELKCVHLSNEDRHYRWIVSTLTINTLNLKSRER